MKALINASLFDFCSFRVNQYVLFKDEIVEVGNMENFPGADEVYDCSETIVMPGLINCHTHIYSTFSRGMSVPFNPMSFQDILDQLWWKLDSMLNRNAVYYSGLVYGCECIKNGVTSIIDHHASGLKIKGTLKELKLSICDDLKMRGIFCFETSDRFSVEECIKENIAFAKTKSDRHAGLFGMHASMSLSDETLKKISEIRGDIPIHIHVAESEEDERKCRHMYGKSIVERLESFNLLDKKSILSHCVHIDEKEAEIIAKRGCIVAVNPTSNMNNSVGLPDYELLRKHNISCIIGNDGLGANITREYLNLTFGMRYKLKSPTKFDLNDLIKAILNGYDYVSSLLGIKLGKFEEGYKSDFITIPYIPPTPMDISNIMGHIFFGVFDNFHPRDTWCSGECLMRDYKVNFDIESIYSRASKEAEIVWNRIKK